MTTKKKTKVNAPAKRKKVARKKKITIKERKFIKGVVKGMPGYKAAKKAGYKGNNNVLGVTSSNLLRKPNVQTAMQKAMEVAGIDDAYLAKIQKDGLEAKVAHYFQRDGTVTDARIDADYTTRHKYLDTAHKLRGDYTPEKIDLSDSEEIKVIAAALRKLAK